MWGRSFPAGSVLAGQATLIVLQLRDQFMAVSNMPLVRGIEATLHDFRNDPTLPQGLRLGMTGSAAIVADMFISAEESIRHTERATIFLVILILLVIYRAPGLVIVPLLTIFASLVVAMGLVCELAKISADYGWFDFKVFSTTRIFIVVILFVAGTDFCLFLDLAVQGGTAAGIEACARRFRSR